MENRRRFLLALGLLALKPLGSILGGGRSSDLIRVQVRYFDQDGIPVSWARLMKDADRWIDRSSLELVINRFISENRIVGTYRHPSLAINEFAFRCGEDIEVLALATQSSVRIQDLNALGIYRTIERV